MFLIDKYHEISNNYITQNKMIDKMPLKSNDHNSTIQTAFATL